MGACPCSERAHPGIAACCAFAHNGRRSLVVGRCSDNNTADRAGLPPGTLAMTSSRDRR